MAEKEWTLQTPPEEYLEQYPDGPNAELARELVDEVVEEVPPEVRVAEVVEEVRAEWAEVHDELDRALLEAKGEQADDVKLHQYRAQTSTSIGRDLQKLELRMRRPSPPYPKVEEAAEVLRSAVERAPELDHGAPLYEDDSHDIVLEAVS